MATILRPGLLRQAWCQAPTKRLITTRASPLAPAAFNITASRSPITAAPKPFQSAFVTRALPASVRVAAFHASSRRNILPPLPQKIHGTANDAAHIPEPHPTHGSIHWQFERLVSIAIIPVLIAPFAGVSANPWLDMTLCGLIVVHSHMGFQACITDYFPKSRVGWVRPLLDWVLRISSLVVAYALYEFETNDVGVVEATKKIWSSSRIQTEAGL